jgi:hypothetical protein
MTVQHAWRDIDPMTLRVQITYFEFCEYVLSVRLRELESLSVGERDAVCHYHWVELQKAIEDVQKARDWKPKGGVE